MSTADWDNPFWTNKQHVAQELARQGHRVLYIDSLGLRRPSVSSRDLSRMIRRIRKAFRLPRLVQQNLWVWSPVLLPFHSSHVVRVINKYLLTAGLQLCMKYLGIRREWFWTYNPLTTGFFDLSDFSCRIYHCVDEIKAQPGMPSELLMSAEKSLAESVDIIFTTSPELTQSRQAWNDQTYYLPNVADFYHFAQARAETTRIPDDLSAIPQPRIGFIGAISGYKVDFSLLRRIASEKPDCSIVLIGQIGEGDPWTDSSLLEDVENLFILGPRDYNTLPAYLKGFDVALLPNCINEYTDAMFPMKFFEYLAAGVPIVSVRLKALQDFSHVAAFADSSHDFVTAIEDALNGRVPSLQHRLDVAGQFTYEARTKKMLELIGSVCKKNEE